ncbi:MAG: response regulator RpfG family c-di-GMP phosphodiesterase [Halieaceae bacterium]|jgi:response regulator RpfG family c-di-GMP phosphodiesterase
MGLAGTDIPVFARIAGIVDSLEADAYGIDMSSIELLAH